MACKPKSQLRAADGMELTHRFGKQTLRMADGGDTMPQNRVPMSEQDQGAFNSLQNTPTGSIVEPAAAPAAKTDVRERMLAAGQRTQTFQPMMNNIAQQPVIAPRPMMLRDGGEVSPWSLKGMAGAVSSAFADSPEQARQKALVAQYKAEKAAAPAPAPVASAPAPTAGIQGYVANGALARREAAAGLRDGGTVPGKGTGDKIPALYEPGEFVVSNDMLDAAPGLREGLHDLRGNVLAAKGKTVEEADAQAVRGGALRAVSGGALPELPSLDFMDKRPAPAPAPIQAALRTPAQVPVVRSAIADAMERAVSKHPMGWQAAPAAPNFETLPGAAGPNNSIKFAIPPEPINATTSLGANTAEARGMTRTAPAPNLTAMNQPGIDTRNAQYAERAAYEAQVARKANPRSMTVKELFTSKDGSVRGNNPLRFNPPGMGPNGVTRPAAIPPSMTRAELFSRPPSGIPNNPNGPLKLAPPVGSEPVGRLAKGLRWAKDAVSAAAKSKFVAPVLDTINSPLGRAVGKLGGVGAQFALHHGDAGAPTLDAERVAAMGRPYDPDWQPGAEGKPYVPRPDSVALWGNETRRNSPMAGVAAPTAPVRGVEDFTKALRDVPNQLPAGLRDGMVYKTKDAKGNVTYSGRNVTGDVSNRMLNGDGTSAGPMRGSLRVASGAPTFGPNGSFVIDNQAPTGAAKQAQINATLRNPDGTQWTARDNAVMAANLRDGVDPYRGTSRAPAQSEDDNIPAIGEFGHNRAVAAKAERDRLKATLRGQDINMQVAMAPAKLAAANRDLIMNVMGHKDIGNDPARGAAYLTSIGRPDLAEGLQKQADASLKMAAESDTLVNNKWKDMQDQFKGQYINPDKNGNPEANAALESRVFARLKRTNPEAFRLDPTQRSQAIRDAIADEELMGAFGNPRDAGFAALVPEVISQNRLDDRTHEIPGKDKLRGTQISDRVGGVRGALSPSLEAGDYMLRTPEGRQTLNLGKLSADAKARLQKFIDESNK